MLPDSTATTLAKAERYLTTGRLTVVEANDSIGLFVASVHGDGDTYTTFRSCTSAEWRCTCPAGARFGRTCAHALAAALVAG